MTPRHSQSQPTHNEDEYFARQDADLIKQMRAKLDEDRQRQERKAHYMKCPKCGGDLKEQTLDQLKVDVCVDCHGLWLDAGEMDLLRHMGKAGGSHYNFVEGFLNWLPVRKSK
jgi:hypothetical protein